MVESHGGITLATLRDVNLDKRCVALPRYIVYVYIYINSGAQLGHFKGRGCLVRMGHKILVVQMRHSGLSRTSSGPGVINTIEP